MTHRASLLAGLTMLALALAPASAGIPPADKTAKQVTKQLAVDAKATLKEVNAQIKTAGAELKAALKPISAAAKDGTATIETAGALFDALTAYQSAMGGAAESAQGILVAVGFGLQTLDPSDDTFVGEYPADFMAGAGGRVDLFYDALERALAKPYPGLRKQLLKLQKLAEKKSGLLLTARLTPVAGLFEQAINVNQTTGGGRLPLTIDVAMGAHDNEDARALWVSGSVTDYGQDVRVELLGKNSSTQDAVLADDRYTRSFFGFNPGNYLFTVRAEGDDQSVRQGIGLR